MRYFCVRAFNLSMDADHVLSSSVNLCRVVLTGHDCWPETYMQENEERAFMQQWSDNMTIALKPFRGASKASTGISVKGTRPLHQPRRGAFAVACYTHSKPFP